MRLALAQLSSSPDRAHNLDRCLAAMDAAARRGAGMIVFPEIVLDRFFPQQRCGGDICLEKGEGGPFDIAETIPGPTTERIAAKAKEHGLVTVFNLYERVDGKGGPRFYDSSPVFDADGTLLGTTRMLHITDYEGFHETDYYHPAPADDANVGAPVFDTRAGKIGVAICYDRHYPEYLRALAVGGADLVVIPQAGAIGEWPEGLFEAEVRTAAFQNGYFAALCNRVGAEEELTFAGESFISAPDGRIVARGKQLEDDLVVADLDFAENAASAGKKLFWRDRRPELYAEWARRAVGSRR